MLFRSAHPANLHALPPVAAAHKTIEYMGGIEAVMAKAQLDLERGEYRWVAEVMKHAVYAHPDHGAARELAAQALEQMGFQAESSTWRNAFVLGAHEYRNGPPQPLPNVMGGGMLGVIGNELLFDALAVRLNGPRSEGLTLTMSWHFTDSHEHWLVEIVNGAMNSILVQEAAEADISLALDRPTLHALLQQELTPRDALSAGRLRLSGDAARLGQFFSLLDHFTGSFPVVDAAALPA